MSASNSLRTTTAMTAAVEALDIAEKRYQALLSATLDPWLRISQDGILLDYHNLEQVKLSPDLFEAALRRQQNQVSYSPEILNLIRHLILNTIEQDITQNADVTVSIQNQNHTYLMRFAKSGPEEALVIIREMTDHIQLEERLFLSQEHLAESEVELERRKLALAVLTEAGQNFQRCASLEEIYRTTAKWGLRLFPNLRGDILLPMQQDESKPEEKSVHKVLKSVLFWGENITGLNDMKISRCYAWMDGSPQTAMGYRCQVASETPPPSDFLNSQHLCIPIFSEGKVFGVLRLLWQASYPIKEIDFQKQVALVLCEQIGLAVSNIHLTQLLREQTLYDSLTQLYNQRYFLDTLQRELHRATREQYSIGIILMELDPYAKILETHGQEALDATLKEIARLLNHSVRASDLVCRYNANTFALALWSVDERIAHARAEEIRMSVRNTRITHQNKMFSITVSTGIALYPFHGGKREDLLKAAETAMNKARENGGDLVSLAEFNSRK